ncbi:MAG: hypothetical protein JWR76_1189 [Mucilaginibacter sp.]|nr:hypothetical protein [Mucilaginibacter sp.]
MIGYYIISIEKHYFKPIIMTSLLYTIAVILIIGWAIGVFFTAAGSLIHILLVIAVIAFLLGVIRRPNAV